MFSQGWDVPQQSGSSYVPQWFMFLMDVLKGSAGRDVPQLVHRVFHSWFTGAGTDTVTGTGTGACLGDRSGAVLLFIPRGCWDMCVSVIVFDKRQINRV